LAFGKAAAMVESTERFAQAAKLDYETVVRMGICLVAWKVARLVAGNSMSLINLNMSLKIIKL
jgi:hypothetical protein